MAIRNCAKLETCSEGGVYMEQPDHEDESLSLCDLPLNLIKEDNPNSLFEKKPRAVETAADEEFDFGSLWGFSNSAAQPPPEMCLADEVIYQGQLLPVRLSVSSDNSSAGLYRRHGSGSGSVGKFRSVNSSGSSSSRRSQCSSSSITSTSAARNSRPRVTNLFHSHPSPKPQIKAAPTTFRQASTGGRSQKSSTWDFFRLGVAKAPGMELQDLKHRSSTRRKSFIPTSGGGGSSDKEFTMRPRARILIETRKSSGGILSGVGCKCSVESTVAPEPKKAVVVVRRNGSSNKITAQAATATAIREKAMRELRMKKVEKEKEQQEKLALSRHRTFEWLKELSLSLSHATLPCDCEPN